MGCMNEPIQRRLAAIMAADVVGYSRMMEQDEAATLARLQAHRRDVVLPRLAAHGGRVVKLMGDGSLVEFGSAVAAVACALEIQSEMEKAESAQPQGLRMRYRIGLNVGDVIIQGDDLYGDGVNIAARLQEVARPGGIALSATIADYIKGKIPLALEDLGERSLKNIERPIRIYAVQQDVLTPSAVPLRADAAKAGQRKQVSLCVLPFANISGDIEQEYFSDGITDDIITDLSKISTLAVIARNTAFTYKSKAVQVDKVSRDLQVEYVLEGSVRRSGNRVRVTAQLIKGDTGFHVWADRFDRTLDDVFAIQDEISKNIVNALKLELLPGELDATRTPQTTSGQAYEIFNIARSLFRRGLQVGNLQAAKRLYEKAYTIDPGYARAYAGHASCDAFLQLLTISPVNQQNVLVNARRALELDPKLADAHAVLGQAYHALGRKVDADTEFANALLLDEGSFDAHYLYAMHCLTWGDYEKAILHYGRASELSPDDYRSPSHVASCHAARNDRETARKWTQEGIKRVERELKARPENVDALAFGAVLLATFGEAERAATWITLAEALNDGNSLVLYNMACFYVVTGRPQEALDHLERLVTDTPQSMAEWVKHDPDLDPIREEPRYRAFIAKLEAESSARNAKVSG
jgi:adenylate cyclase